MQPAFDLAPIRLARTAGLMYLAIIVLGVFGEMFVRGSLVVSGDPVGTANRIAQSELLWRAGIAGDLLMHILDIPVIWILYLLLKPVSRSLALLATLFNLIQTAVLAVNKLSLVLPLLLLDDPGVLQSFSSEQLSALSYLAIEAHAHGFGVGLIFFGFACLVRGYLIHRSGYLPRTLGILLQLAGLSYLVNSFALLLAPSLASALFPAILLPAFIGELALSVWLVVKGVDVTRWATAGHVSR